MYHSTLYNPHPHLTSALCRTTPRYVPQSPVLTSPVAHDNNMQPCAQNSKFGHLASHDISKGSDEMSDEVTQATAVPLSYRSTGMQRPSARARGKQGVPGSSLSAASPQLRYQAPSKSYDRSWDAIAQVRHAWSLGTTNQISRPRGLDWPYRVRSLLDE